LTASSYLLIAYSPTANQRGWPQGTFFNSGKAAILGWLGLIGGLIASYMTSGFTGLLGVGIGTWLLTGAVLGWFRSQSQIISVIGFFAGCILAAL
jgi:hypothetical protein